MYCLSGMFLFQEFMTNRTASLPHIQTWLPTYEIGLQRQKASNSGLGCLSFSAHNVLYDCMGVGLALIYHQMDLSFSFDGFQSSKPPIHVWL